MQLRQALTENFAAGVDMLLGEHARVGFKGQRPAHKHAGEMPFLVLAGRVIGVVIFSH